MGGAGLAYGREGVLLDFEVVEGVRAAITGRCAPSDESAPHRGLPARERR
jgi:hypothetical protein